MKNVVSIIMTVILYTATGSNPMGERVLAEIVDQHQNGTVTGIVYDRLAGVPVAGEWAGVGMITVEGVNGVRYELEVVE